MTKKILSIALIGALGVGFSGCAVDKFATKYDPDNVKRMLMKSLSGDSKEKFERTFESRYWSKEFSKYYDDDNYTFDYTRNNIKITKHLVYFSENVYLGQAPEYVQNHSSNNEFIELYKNKIIERGNNYKVLRGAFNAHLLRLIYGYNVKPFNRESMQYVKTKLIPVVAEFDNNDNLVSLMLNIVKIAAEFDQVRNPNVQSEIILENYFYVGSKLNAVKNNISQVEWKNQLLYTNKK